MSNETRFAEIDEAIEEMNRRLQIIARQNAQLAEMVQVRGAYDNTSIDLLQAHVSDKHPNAD